jgi:2-oxo-3-(phosphooxy)propyl 3-oxoalkanoate synthase
VLVSDVATTAASLGFDRTLSPEKVYKIAPEQVFVTDWVHTEDTFTIAARLPRAHARFNDTCSAHADIVLMAEVVNQAGVIVAANALEVPLESRFLLRRFAVSLDPIEHNLLGAATTSLTLTTDRENTSFKARPNGETAGGSMTSRNMLADRPSGSSTVTGIWVSESIFQGFRRKRGQALAESGTAALEREPNTGRRSEANCVITRLDPTGAPRAYRCQVIVDQDDPTFYDRPLDHVPGLLLFEAARQAATAAWCRERRAAADGVVVCGVEFSFSAFAELDAPLWCGVELTESLDRVDAEFRQNDKRLCRARLSLAAL